MKNQSEKRALTRRMIVVIFILGAVLTWFFANQAQNLPAGSKPTIPTKLTFLSGSLDQIQDTSKPLVVNFWATWCAPCLQELPVFAKVFNDYAGSVQFVGLSVDSPEADIAALRIRFHISYPLAVAPWEMVNAWKAEQLPTTYVLNKDREIVWSHKGAVSEKELVAAIQSASGTK